MVKQELVNKIKDYFELNIYETKVWLALLGKGSATAGEIAKISGVPRSRTYDVLESLEKKGFAIIKIGKPIKYLGVKPNMIIEKMKKDVKKNAEEKVNILSKIKNSKEYDKLQELYNEGINPIKREELSASLKGRSNISNYLREILNQAKQEVIICTHAQEMNSKLKLFKNTIESLKENNVAVLVALSGNDELINKISKELGVSVEKIDVKAKFFIVDRTQILFYLSQRDDAEDIAIWLNSSFFVNSMIAMFEKAIGKDTNKAKQGSKKTANKGRKIYKTGSYKKKQRENK